MIRYVKGDITKSNSDIICHQVNCQGAMNSGVAKAIREKWPEVYDNYKIWCDRNKTDTKRLLGLYQAIQINDNPQKWVVNLFAQQCYGYNGTRYTDYEAFYNCIYEISLKLTDNLKDKTIAFPYKIGCVRGGANWNIIRTMIEEAFAEHDVTFYYLNDDDLEEIDKKYVIAQNYQETLKGLKGLGMICLNK